MTHFKAVIISEAYKDSFEHGQAEYASNQWNETLTADTTEELKQMIIDATYTPWEFIERDEELGEMRGLDEVLVYHTSYLTNEENEGDASEAEKEEWRDGKIDLYAVNCTIMVSKVTESKIEL